MKNVFTQSPLPKKGKVDENLFDFPTAMKKVAEGKKISKKEWNNTNVFGEIKDGLLQIHKEDDKYYAWAINDGDLEGKDWFVL